MEYPGIAHYDPAMASATEDMLLFSDGATQFSVDGDAYEISSQAFVATSEHYEEDYSNAEFQETRSILADGGDHFGVSAIAFDQQEELLWMGNQGGHVTSYYGTGLQKYTSFQVHANQEVRHIHTFDDGILALTRNTLRCQIRRGIPVFTHSSVNMEEMQCQLQISPDVLLMGGHQEKIIEFNLLRRQETKLHHVGKNGCAILRQHGRFVCAGDPSGRIDLRDPVTLAVEHTLEAHSGSLSDFDVHGNLLVTCGFSNRQCGLSVDRFLMVYDLRMMRAVAPLPVILDPLLLRFLPSYSSRVATVSALGQMQLVDTVAHTSTSLCLYQVNTAGSMCLTFDVSSSCQCMAFGDAGGSIHLYTSSPHTAMFNTFSRETEFADPVEPLPPISILDEVTPLSTIPLPYTQPGTSLLSDWPDHFLRKVYRRTPQIDPEILRTMKMQGTIGYAPNPMSSRRNQVAYKLEKHGRAKCKLFNDSQSGSHGDDVAFIAIPKRYRKIDVKYSKLGMDDFDFDQYNKTSFCGLEATLPNSYCNAMLQVLYYTVCVRRVMLSHICSKEFCLSCELGFLFHMLDISQGFPCQSSNFLRAFRTVPEASALGLILSDLNPESKKKVNLARLIQNWNRFILHQIHFEVLETKKHKQEETQNNSTYPGFVYNEQDFPSILGDIQSKISRNTRQGEEDSQKIDATVQLNEENQIEETEITRFFGTKQTNVHICMTCNNEVTKNSVVFLTNLTYPELTAAKMEYSFCDILLRSLFPEQTTPAWCEKCDRYRQTIQSRKIRSLPHILVTNCGLDVPKNKQFWQKQMDLVVQKVAELPNSHNPKPCRYGVSCSRPGCRFKHAGRASGGGTVPNSGQLYCAHSWLPMHIQMQLLSDGDVKIGKVQKSEDSSKDEKLEDNVIQSVTYDLSAVVCYVQDHINPDKSNLVALINVAPEYHERSVGSPVSQWYIFNDFSIAPITAQEVVWFSLDWKVPCVLYWTNRKFPEEIIPLVKNPLTVDVFGEDKCLARNDERKMITFTPLSADEMPGAGDIVAMDAEFVTLNQEEAELRSDGKMSTIKPSHMSVARITCIRGHGPLAGTAFIDDYISTQEQVVDYLTKFSGIKPGDLDANFSSKHLTTLKSTYQKLRFLVDNGVKFVGHGLKNDFRVINLVVPVEQIIDTVHLFHLPHHRMVSLRFLAWHFLGLKIQSETHDSIEDARTALQLYQRYLELEKEGAVKAALKELYEVGKQFQWKVPGAEDNVS